MKCYVLTDTKEQEMLMDIVNALTDEQKNLIVKFGSEMHCQGYLKGISDVGKYVAIGLVGGISLCSIAYFVSEHLKVKKSKIEVE